MSLQQPATGDESLIVAFPSALEQDVRTVLALMPPSRLRPTRPFTVRVQDERLAIPTRLYNPEPPAALQHLLSPVQAAISACLYSRHNDGYVRQRRVEQIAQLTEPWVVPFVVQLVGEYVLEILVAIRRGLPELAVAGSLHHTLYGHFVAANPQFFARMERRVVSYWSCYWRLKYSDFWCYPGCELLKLLHTAAQQTSGQRLPRFSPRGNPDLHGYC